MHGAARILQIGELNERILIDAAHFFQVNFQNFAILEKSSTQILVCGDLLQIANE